MYSVVTQSTEFVQDGFCCNRRLMLPGLPQAGNHTEDFAVQGKDCFMTKKILCVFMVFALIFSLGACKKVKDNTSTAGGTSANAGETEVVTDDEGEPVTDESGDTVTVMSTTSEPEIVTNAKGQPVTNKSGETVTVATTAAATTEYVFISDETMPTGEPIEVTTNTSGKPIEVTTKPDGKPIEVTTKPSGNPTDLPLDKSFFNILKGKKYYMKFTAQMDMDDTKQTIPVAIYVSDKKSLVELTMGGADLGLGAGLAKMSLLNNTNGNYLLISILGVVKGYVKMPADQAGEYDDMFNFSGIEDTSDMTYVKTTKVTYKGVEYICEEYRGSDATTKYFFNKGKLVRIEQVSDDGSKMIMENIEISAKFDENIFSIPSGYKEISEKDLEGLSGLLG